MKSEVIVIDNGSQTCKMGMSSQERPMACFQNVVGRNLFKNQLVGLSTKQHFEGDEAMDKISILNVKSPFDRGIIQNWEDMTHLWYHGFYNEIRRDCSEYPCLMSEPLQTPKAQRQKITQLMFEHFLIPKFYLQKAPRLGLYSLGATSGMVIDCGHNLTQYCPFINNNSIPLGIQVNEWGGIDINRYLIKLLKQLNIKIHNQQINKFRSIKQNHCYVALDYQNQLLKFKQSNYELPDGRMVALGDQRFRCSEILFDPLLVGKKVSSLQQTILNSMKNCQKQTHRILYQNIFLTGGSSLLPGFSERLTKQLTSLTQDNIKITNSKENQYTNWVGGRILASLSIFDNICITKKQFEEQGARIIHKKSNK